MHILLGKQNRDFGKEVLYGKNAQQQDIPIDVSNAADIPDHPDIQETNDRGEYLLPNIEPGDEAAPGAEAKLNFFRGSN